VPNALPKLNIVGLEISLGTFAEHLDRFVEFATRRQSSYVVCVNSHMTVEAAQDAAFREVVNNADFATADGMPLLRAMQWSKYAKQERAAGNDLIFAVLKRASENRLPIYFYGGCENVLNEICIAAKASLPELIIAGTESPPFRPLSDEEMDETASRINASGAQIVMVSLGCPKQEKWMARMAGKVNAIMLGVGGTFLLYAGRDTRAPKWMRDLCMEWMYRLTLEPTRLWKRYFITNPVFAYLVLKDWLGQSSAALDSNDPG